MFLDIASRRPADFIKRKLPSMYHQFKELAEVDITAEPMEVGPTLHYFMGGIRVDADSQMTTVPGLFACGECAAGLHGANRLGGNSLSDLIVFGKLAGTGASELHQRPVDARRRPTTSRSSAASAARPTILKRDSGTNPYVLHEKLQDTMQVNVGIIREKEELETGARGARRPQEGGRDDEGAGREPVQPRLARGAVDEVAARSRPRRSRAPR